MKKQFLSAMAKAVTKFKDKDKTQEQDQGAVRTPESEKTALMNSIKKEFSTFFMDTSFTALNQIYKANSLWKRVVWTVLIIIMFLWMGVQCCWLLEKYYHYPIEVKMDLKVSTVLDFPSVTICNLNPILETAVHNDPYTPLIKYVKLEVKDSLYEESIAKWNFNETCGLKQVKCNNGICMKERLKCNGLKDCSSGEDEDNCEDYKCPPYLWKCKSSPKCIGVNSRCDGSPGACSKNTKEDEDDCENYHCPNDRWKCTSLPKCIDINFRCNGIPGDCKVASTEDEDDCENYQCPNSHWKCTSLSKCISINSRCDGIPGDCNVTSTEDEDDCENYQCPIDRWKCTSLPKCISIYSRCNGTSGDCNVTSTEDEDDCENYQCSDVLWKCTSQPKCIGVSKRCNGIPGDCNATTTEDEDGCKNSTCLDGFFRCSSGRCVPSRWRCDGYNDCGSDELDCTDLNTHAHRNDVSTMTPSDPRTMIRNEPFNKWNMLEDENISLNFYNEHDDDYKASVTYAYITAKLNSSFLEKSGHRKIDFIAACKFGGYQCSPMNFTYFHNHKFGNCYTFNSKFGNSSNLTTRFPGRENGLKLELFLDQEQYVANLAPDAGVRILVHKKGSMPFPEDDGISIMPGRSTSIGIKQVSLSRLKPPYGPCGYPAKTKDHYATIYGTLYSKLSCLKSCYQDLIMKTCICAAPFYYVPDNVTVCNLTEVYTEKCVDSLSTSNLDGNKNCDKMCPVPCSETKYELTISSATWPSENYKNYLGNRLNQTNYLYTDRLDIDKEFCKLQIYFQDLIYEQIDQHRAYESMNLISDFGGQLGLWLGLSAITMGEVCSFLFGVGRSLLFKWRGIKSKPSDLTPIMNIKPATIEDMCEEMCPEPVKHSPPEVTTLLPGSI